MYIRNMGAVVCPGACSPIRREYPVFGLAVAGITLALLLLVSSTGFSQSQRSTKNLIGTITLVNPGDGRLEIKQDNGEPVSLTFGAKTIALRVAPGEKDLKNAATIQLSDLLVGDRVLVTTDAGSTDVRRVIVMSSADIAKRNETDRQDWMKRGVSGIVAAKTASQIILKMRSFQGPMQATVTVDEHTRFKRYSPDSVRFVDAKLSSLEEVSMGDQLRARGQKSEDGLHVTAEEIVFGTFLTKAGSVESVNADSKEITVKELGTNKPFVVKLTGDSQLKRMPDFAAAAPAAGRPGPSAGGGDSALRGESAASPPRGPMGGAGGPRDISQMLEHMPSAALEDLKPGSLIVVSSTKGAQSGQLTAIMLVANADRLIRMATQQGASDRESGAGARSSGGGVMGQMEGFGGFELPGMIQ